MSNPTTTAPTQTVTAILHKIKQPLQMTQILRMHPRGVTVFEYRNGHYLLGSREGAHVTADWTRIDGFDHPVVPLDRQHNPQELVALTARVNAAFFMSQAPPAQPTAPSGIATMGHPSGRRASTPPRISA